MGVQNIIRSKFLFWIDKCPRCGEKGKLNAKRPVKDYPRWYGYCIHFAHDGFPHGKIVRTCYLGKIINNAIHCSFSPDIINLPNFDIGFENEIILNMDNLGVIEVWCYYKDCEHNSGSLCGNSTIEIGTGGCMSFSRKENWKDAI